MLSEGDILQPTILVQSAPDLYKTKIAFKNLDVCQTLGTSQFLIIMVTSFKISNPESIRVNFE